MAVTAQDVEVLRLADVWKSFDGVDALKGVTFAARAGEIHALLGENGAGKSTLMAIAAGSLAPDRGQVELGGEPVRDATPVAIRQRGLSIAYQHPALVPDLTVYENIAMWLPRQVREAGKEAMPWAAAQLSRVGCQADLTQRVSTLGVAQRHLLEIAKAMASDPAVLILDEPTAALGADDSAVLFAELRRLAGSGVAVVYITHRLAEVRELCQKVTVLRDGSIRGTFAVTDITDAELLELIVGRAVTAEFPPKPAQRPARRACPRRPRALRPCLPRRHPDRRGRGDRRPRGNRRERAERVPPRARRPRPRERPRRTARHAAEGGPSGRRPRRRRGLPVGRPPRRGPVRHAVGSRERADLHAGAVQPVGRDSAARGGPRGRGAAGEPVHQDSVGRGQRAEPVRRKPAEGPADQGAAQRERQAAARRGADPGRRRRRARRDLPHPAPGGQRGRRRGHRVIRHQGAGRPLRPGGRLLRGSRRRRAARRGRQGRRHRARDDDLDAAPSAASSAERWRRAAARPLRAGRRRGSGAWAGPTTPPPRCWPSPSSRWPCTRKGTTPGSCPTST